MADLKAQLKTLIAAKEYKAAIVLLESSDLPDKKTYIARIQLRMKEEAKAAAALKPAPELEPVKQPRSRWLTCAYIAAIVSVLVVGCGVILKFQADRAWDAAFGGLTVEQVIGSSDLKVYCDSIEAPLNCEVWATRIVTDEWIAANICLEYNDWIRERDTFTMCLLNLGITPIPGHEVVDGVETSDWTDADYDVVAMLSRYCDGERNKDYCVAWSMVTYRDGRNAIWGCSQQHRNDQVGFTRCVQGLGVKA